MPEYIDIAFIEEPENVYFLLLFSYVKALAFRHKWKAHAGESTHDTSNILFSVKQSHPLQIKKQINIFLANNFKKKEPDFHITGAYTSLSFKVYEGRRLIAEVLTNSFYAYIFGFRYENANICLTMFNNILNIYIYIYIYIYIVSFLLKNDG